MAQTFIGTCGRLNPRPCKVVYSTSFKPFRVGNYPYEYLPSEYTVWYASATTIYSFDPPTIPPGWGPLPMVGMFSATGAFSFQFKNWNSTSYYTWCFSRTVNRINRKITLTEEHFANIQEEETDGTATLRTINIDMSEYLFDVLAVVDYPNEPISNNQPSISIQDKSQELYDLYVAPDANNTEDDEGLQRARQDRYIQKLFEWGNDHIPDDKNRFVKIVPNLLGIEYRLDNTATESTSIITHRYGDINSSTYNDGSSKILQIDILKKYQPKDEDGNAVGDPRDLAPGDNIYVTYIGVPNKKDHYLRQHFHVRWSGQAGSLQGSHLTSIRWQGANYRFYSWELDKVNANDPDEEVVRLEGWRAVETYNSFPNWTALWDTNPNPELGDWGRGQASGVTDMDMLHGNVTYPGLLEWMDGVRHDFNTVSVNFSESTMNAGNYHPSIAPDNYLNVSWAQSVINDAADLNRHLYYNVHPKALKKRDIDKWAIPRQIAEFLVESSEAQETTYFPFMDNPYNLDTTQSLGNDPNLVPAEDAGQDKYLNVRNFEINPIERPSSAYSGDGAGAENLGLLGFASTSADNIFMSFSFSSPIITEEFAVGTKVLIERFFTSSSRGPELLSVEGKQSLTQGVSCILDPTGEYQFLFHSHNGWMSYYMFETGLIQSSQRALDYEPYDAIKTAGSDPSLNVYNKYLGYSGMLGDRPGYKYGKLVSVSHNLTQGNVRVQTTNAEAWEGIVEDSAIGSVTWTVKTDRITIQVKDGYHGFLEIRYNYEDHDWAESMILVGQAGEENIIDTVTIVPGNDRRIQVDFPWYRCSSIDILLPNPSLIDISRVDIYTLDEDKANNFLDLRTESPGESYELSGPVLFSSSIISVGEDSRSNLFVFFGDTEGGISTAISRDFGISWTYQFGIVEKMDNKPALYPFIVNHFETDENYLFYVFDGKILCKPIRYSQINTSDDFKIVKFEEDILQDDGKELSGILSDEGRQLRGHDDSWVAAGNINDDDFLEYTQPITRNIEYNTEDGYESTLTATSRYPIQIGSGTCFHLKDMHTPYFSAFRSDTGNLYLWFLGLTTNGKQRLQCHFSTNNGQEWYDLWETANYGLTRRETDEDLSINYININENGTPDQDDSFSWGLNLHKQGEDDQSEEDISCPYVYYQSTTQQLFFFYIYRYSLFCKRVDEQWLHIPYDDLKENIEGTLSEFIDGYIHNTTLVDQIDTSFVFQWRDYSGGESTAIETFDDSRSIRNGRVCACELPNGNVRIFYKTTEDETRAAYFNGTYWIVENLLRATGDN